MSNSSGTTAVPEKDLPQIPEPVFVNAPTTLEDAIKRILELEMRLDDLARCAEIAEACGQIEMLGPFAKVAMEALENKIVIEQPDFGPMKITVVTDDEEEKK